jgi:hypothetical protein
MRGAKLIRYCDDLVILCRGNPQLWFRRLDDIIGRLGLTLSAEKTRTVDAADGFDFLGMHFRLMPMRSVSKARHTVDLYVYHSVRKFSGAGIRSAVLEPVSFPRNACLGNWAWRRSILPIGVLRLSPCETRPRAG